MAQGRSTTIISTIQWTRTVRLPVKISLSVRSRFRVPTNPKSSPLHPIHGHVIRERCTLARFERSATETEAMLNDSIVLVSAVRCRANMAHVGQSRSDSGLGFQVQVFKTFLVVPSSLARGHLTRARNLYQMRLISGTPPHETTQAIRFISQLLNFSGKHAKSVCQQLAQWVST